MLQIGIVWTLPFREIQKSSNQTGFIRGFRTLQKTDLTNVYKPNVIQYFLNDAFCLKFSKSDRFYKGFWHVVAKHYKTNAF